MRASALVTHLDTERHTYDLEDDDDLAEIIIDSESEHTDRGSILDEYNNVHKSPPVRYDKATSGPPYRCPFEKCIYAVNLWDKETLL